MLIPKNTIYPILYSLRNCPYAMRARLAIFKSKQQVELRDVVLSNKPQAMLIASPKGTVPILVFESEKGSETLKVIDESLDIMLWALQTNDPDNLLGQSSMPNGESLQNMLSSIATFDTEFKTDLEKYKCAKRYHEDNLLEYRQACEAHIQTIEKRLQQHTYIMSNEESLVDIALLPFIRQFARVERQWYLQAPYPNLRQWLNNYLQSPMFSKVMTKYPLWLEANDRIILG
ncbi:glutathione S-transferase [Colwellia sp. MSW7]|uniref:Glutathione S-transferase n=1 Tax=Colwellia maritima TaxID=2912588 RepID=A0ABS9X5J3_9GAMM|nr:glutathione S-transferase [Colwellia maritima]MCI2284711.1 glutathione S-transferase [Colwellia maritima]